MSADTRAKNPADKPADKPAAKPAAKPADKAADTSAVGEAPDFVSLVRDDQLFRVQRALGLIPAQGLGVVRRMIAYAPFAWLPLAIWAWLHGRALGGALDEPLFEHFGVNARCLLAIPLLVAAEGVAHTQLHGLLAQFERAGLVRSPEAYRAVLASVARLRDSTLPWVVIAGLVFAWTLLAPRAHHPHELLWAESGPVGLGFGGWWYLYVARPLYVTLCLAWLWRLVLAVVLMRRLARLELALVPTHPDRLAGLGFLEALPSAFSLVVLAFSVVLAAAWGHDVVYHDVHIASLKLEAAAFVVLMLGLFLAPLAVFAPVLVRTRRLALAQYAAFVAQQGRAVHAGWIEPQGSGRAAPGGERPDPEQAVNANALYDAVAAMRTLPVGKKALLAVLVPTVAPMLVVVTAEIPLRTLLLSIVKTLT
jgi:hypothetical protein